MPLPLRRVDVGGNGVDDIRPARDAGGGCGLRAWMWVTW